MAILLLSLSVITFIIIQLPPGDYITARLAGLEASGTAGDEAAIAALKRRYGLDLPVYAQYFEWMGKMFHGDFGMSFQYNKRVSQLIAERLPLTIVKGKKLFYTADLNT